MPSETTTAGETRGGAASAARLALARAVAEGLVRSAPAESLLIRVRVRVRVRVRLRVGLTL